MCLKRSSSKLCPKKSIAVAVGGRGVVGPTGSTNGPPLRGIEALAVVVEGGGMGQVKFDKSIETPNLFGTLLKLEMLIEIPREPLSLELLLLLPPPLTPAISFPPVLSVSAETSSSA